MDFNEQIENLRVRMTAEVRQTHDRLGELSTELMTNDRGLMDHITKILSDHDLRRRDIAARLSDALISGPPPLGTMAKSDPVGVPSFMNGKSLQ